MVIDQRGLNEKTEAIFGSIFLFLLEAFGKPMAIKENLFYRIAMGFFVI